MRRLLPESRFVRRIAMLSGGTLLGQLVLAGSSPVLTRLYGPAAFGGLAVFMSLWSILVVMAACRYEFAVPVVPDERDAAGLGGVGGVAAAATALEVWLGGERRAAATDVPVLAPLLWLLPAIVLCGGLALAFGLACAVPMEAMTVIGLRSAGTTLAYLLYLGLSWQVVRRGGLSPVAAPEVEVAPLES